MTDSSVLSSLFTSLQNTGTAVYRNVTTSGKFQFYDFAQGLDGSLVNLGYGPIVTPPSGNPSVVPLPAAGFLLLGGLAGLAGLRRRRKS